MISPHSGRIYTFQTENIGAKFLASAQCIDAYKLSAAAAKTKTSSNWQSLKLVKTTKIDMSLRLQCLLLLAVSSTLLALPVKVRREDNFEISLERNSRDTTEISMSEFC